MVDVWILDVPKMINFKKGTFRCYYCSENITVYPCCSCGKGFKK